ncbi:PREDICTED: CD9 antigen [Rhagoletis zephyria]|uniref:CD9 antigen n=1 Tax=Rhagoletis zephyria TaxID=28612 RepID=UPI00081195B3|nr:PREDICTED: CD9 antigen [Rhagoletis zephyria]XP_017470875.1 PREDICTED: CD9 antigen [Rhagoletis zephyria]XP_017470876.1 PREDICTED: CD9 antigen [Rhagoletis zephyria]XP_017470877.1 PREDICTED: CD9 antigen [Rhagoletis zephyria]XP_017470878.1 PREDICTED: CD9 antigen [Rhagoletis zephyria]XP_017470879.1 PREDICTED: CD9 antigen [Rhagoletis zephyria]XP_017470880.1 PREDICTED: CD9 antigen [Rhagoletis zephyria]XP_036339521.1 tetraspanin-2A isoform X3 [Rhagoletis pomonella]XP_036339522.1 tetraspanin-2A i
MGFGRQENTLEKQIGCVKYTLFCFNIVAWMFATALFALSVWLRAEQGFNNWLTILQAQMFYIGVYILIGSSIIMMAVSFLGCLSALMENELALLVFMGTQIFGFLAGVAGSAVLLDFSTMHSSLQPLLRNSLTQYVSTSEYAQSRYILNMIQSNIGCCGATGPWDYWNLHQPLPNSCRDTVSGNCFFNGCVDELTWFFEGKTSWIVAVALALSLLNVISAVLSLVLVQAVKKEEDEARTYRH